MNLEPAFTRSAGLALDGQNSSILSSTRYLGSLNQTHLVVLFFQDTLTSLHGLHKGSPSMPPSWPSSLSAHSFATFSIIERVSSGIELMVVPSMYSVWTYCPQHPWSVETQTPTFFRLHPSRTQDSWLRWERTCPSRKSSANGVTLAMNHRSRALGWRIIRPDIHFLIPFSSGNVLWSSARNWPIISLNAVTELMFTVNNTLSLSEWFWWYGFLTSIPFDTMKKRESHLKKLVWIGARWELSFVIELDLRWMYPAVIIPATMRPAGSLK